MNVLLLLAATVVATKSEKDSLARQISTGVIACAIYTTIKESVIG